jgi:hypothetical protein
MATSQSVMIEQKKGRTMRRATQVARQPVADHWRPKAMMPPPPPPPLADE